NDRPVQRPAPALGRGEGAPILPSAKRLQRLGQQRSNTPEMKKTRPEPGFVVTRPGDQAAVFLAALAGADAALTAVFVSVWKLASATSVACLVAFCTLSIALVAAAMADFTRAAADSVPAGAFLMAL